MILKGDKTMIYGYARISTKKQSIERQIRNIKQYCNSAVIVTEEYTGTSMNRKEWNKLISKVKAQDIIIFDSVSRMSRSAEDGFTSYEELFNKGVNLVFIKEPHINTEVYKSAISNSVKLTGGNVDFILEGVNKYLMALAREQIKIAFEQAEKEVKDLHDRTKEGIETARLNGKQIGRAKGSTYTVKSKQKKMDMIKKYSKSFDGNLSDDECMKLIDISRNTYYKYKKELNGGI